MLADPLTMVDEQLAGTLTHHFLVMCSQWYDMGQYYVFIMIFSHIACVRSRRTVQNKTAHHISLIKRFKHSIEFKERSPLDIRKSNVRMCCAVYLLISAIPATSRTVRRQSQSMASSADFTILQFLYFGRSRAVLSVLPLLNIPCQVYASVLVHSCNVLLISIGKTCRQALILMEYKLEYMICAPRLCLTTPFSALHTLPWCTSFMCIFFLNTAKSTWWRQNDTVIARYDFLP